MPDDGLKSYGHFGEIFTFWDLKIPHSQPNISFDVLSAGGCGQWSITYCV
jgi:hypothetical protein